MRRLACAGIVLAALAMGCKDQRMQLAPGRTITVRGELAAGVECPMLVARDGRRYSVGGDLGRFKIGDRVCVKGTIAEVSFCMAGEATITIEAIGPEDSCP